MPRLRDLLEYMAQPGLEDLWVLLDIKLDNHPNDVMRLIGETISSVPPSKDRPWNERVVLGIWAVRISLAPGLGTCAETNMNDVEQSKYLPLCATHVPDFPISYIGFSTSYARQFFSVPNISFNMLQASLMGPIGASFIRKAQSLNRPVFAWTVNEEKKMRWGIRKGLDGIVTDDPKKFLDICDEVERDGVVARKETLTWKELWAVIRIQLLVAVFGMYFRWKFGVGWGVDKRFVRRETSIPAMPN
jgi:Glycerophosphoryl diester phosphodiesterase family